MDSLLRHTRADRDALLIMIKVTPDGAHLPFSAELRGGLTRIRFHFAACATLRTAFAPAAADCFETLLADIAASVGVMSFPDFSADLPGVALRQCRATIGATHAGDELIALRFRYCVGDALGLFSDEAMPGEALQDRRTVESPPDHPGNVLRDVLMPLFNLRQYLADTSDTEHLAHVSALSTLLRNVEMQIGEIEDCYFTRMEELRGAESPPAVTITQDGPGVENALAALRQNRPASSLTDATTQARAADGKNDNVIGLPAVALRSRA